jgi:uncharacterized damage-inducible protein DinB
MVTSDASPTKAAAVQSPAHLCFADFAPEMKSTRRVLERYPDGKGAWKPHEKSRTLGQLATHVADVVNRGTSVLETDAMEVGARPPAAPLDSAAELLSAFDANVERLNRALTAADSELLAKPYALRAGGRVLMELPRRAMLRFLIMSHLIHHRAQLGVYLRLLGVAVPGVYGPSADDKPL